MKIVIEEIVKKLNLLPDIKIFKVLKFIDSLTLNARELGGQELEQPPSQENETFESLADCLAEEFQLYAGVTIPLLSDYAVSRAGIYEEHP
ncbi:hypothetical protein [Oscillatoria sp. FACHB-1406]|uniref:hypothetical protein n=1 Tax=Oscillatoria sp. FACHB-1406 TaxID=2692846 RepID=UPI001685DE7E|nr:hypothetical protein [Oscillatoria sp. FACHB-1406]MBD2577878.1 hypothetical protein [Oscillatoria sp. FACHB-1406]